MVNSIRADNTNKWERKENDSKTNNKQNDDVNIESEKDKMIDANDRIAEHPKEKEKVTIKNIDKVKSDLTKKIWHAFIKDIMSFVDNSVNIICSKDSKKGEIGRNNENTFTGNMSNKQKARVNKGLQEAQLENAEKVSSHK